MPTRVLVEGPEIEPLLAQIREEYGPDVRIVSADKVRSGGVAGFFSKQHYEIAVEVDDAESAPPPVAPALPSPVATSPGAVWPATDGTGGPVTLLDLVEARRDRYEGTGDERAAADADAAVGLPPRAGLVSTAGTTFAGVMAGLRAEGLATPERPQAAVPPATAVTRELAATPEAPAVPEDDAAPLVRPYRPAVVPPGSAPVMPAATMDPGTVADAAGAAAPAVATAPAGSVDTRSPAGGARTAVAHTEPAAPWAATLLGLGLPAALATKAHGSDPYKAVLRAFAGISPPPGAPARPGDILVLVGDVGRALPLGLRIAEGLRLDEGKILLAAATAEDTSVNASGRISGPANAERRARLMHRADTPHVVVVDAPIDDTDPEWVRDVCDALGATAVWAVADATRKTADTARYLSGFGKVDALAAYAVRACGDPASLLHIGPAVALLDGRPATAHAWAALLSERLLSTSEVGHGAG